MRKFFVLLLVVSGLSGCASTPVDRLLFIEESHIGLKAKASPDMSSPADIDFGYRRSILTLIPGSKAEADKADQDSTPKDIGEVLSVISAFSADVGWFTSTEVHTYFATGEAAKNVAKSDKAIKALLSDTQVSAKENKQ